MSILMMINLKGGVAKTTTTVAIAECLASQGLRTLVIDADHQCMSSELLIGEQKLIECDLSRTTLHDLLGAMLDEDFVPAHFEQFMVHRASNIAGGLKNLSLLPCSLRIDDFQTNMAKARRGFLTVDEFDSLFTKNLGMFQRWLTNNYDYTLIDCPPSLALQVKQLLRISDSYIVPCIPDQLSVRGSLHLMDRLQKRGNKIHPLGTIWTLYREQVDMHKRIITYAKQRSNERLNQMPQPFQSIIPNATKIAEASEPNQQPKSFELKYTKNFAKLFHQLVEEIVHRCEWQSANKENAAAAVEA